MGLDIGVGRRGFIADLDRENQIAGDIANRCRTCGRDKRLNAKRTELITTHVLERCPECRAPLVWEKTNSRGEKETWEWHIESNKPVLRKERQKGIRINFD